MENEAAIDVAMVASDEPQVVAPIEVKLSSIISRVLHYH